MKIERPTEKQAKESARPELPTAQTSEPVQVLGMCVSAEGENVTLFYYLKLPHFCLNFHLGKIRITEITWMNFNEIFCKIQLLSRENEFSFH